VLHDIDNVYRCTHRAHRAQAVLAHERSAAHTHDDTTRRDMTHETRALQNRERDLGRVSAFLHSEALAAPAV
jgi:hypothetical protein